MAASRSHQSNEWQKKVLCRFFANGTCRAGDTCPYGHDRSLSNKGTLPCKFFAVGTCAHGSKCRFSHGEPSTSTSSLVKEPQKLPSKAQPSLNPGAKPWTPSSTSWAEAPTFVPKSLLSENKTEDKIRTEEESNDSTPKSWAQIVNPNAMADLTVEEAESQLCPFYLMGECRYGDQCAYIHGLSCEFCDQHMLHPTHEAQRRSHQKLCLEQHEAEMEQAFAIAKSKDRTCGICMEIVMDKPKGENRFGIMPNCNHCFCLPCLRKWRQAKQFENKIIRACPECRQTSDYICPSQYWVDTPEEKEKLFNAYRDNLTKKECKYFNKGQGECPFGNKCFYRHAKDGKDVDVGPPQKNLRHNLNGDPSLVERILLYDFLEERDGHLLLPLEIFDVLDFLSDSEESELSLGDLHI